MASYMRLVIPIGDKQQQRKRTWIHLNGKDSLVILQRAMEACTCSQLSTLSSQEALWTNICNSTWPSTKTPRIRHVISTFPNGPRSFSPTPSRSSQIWTAQTTLPKPSRPYVELISAVDVYYKGNLVFSKVIETETVTGWFKCSPFRLDLLDPKDVVPTPIRLLDDDDDTCRDLQEDLELSWILIDPIGRRAMNVSSQKPVSVQRHWLSGEVHVRFATILAGDHHRGSSSEFVQCGVVITCGGSQGRVVLIKEISLQAEDMDGFIEWEGQFGNFAEGNGGKKGIKRGRGRKEKVPEFLERKKLKEDR
ncbi:f-box protein [Quercus suber]|uniref:F-box protein n=1 Tax=Quercus suber TaxID=58331 RepID=A0AAW0L7C2_QUESU